MSHLRWVERPLLALRRPDLVWRWMRGVRGAHAIEIALEEIANHVPDRPVILEAGGHGGEDTERLASRWPDGWVHVFEPVPASFAIMTDRVGQFPNVTAYRLALSTTSGPSEMFLSAGAQGGHQPGSSSLLAPTGHLEEFPDITFGETINIQCITLADWASTNGIGRIDLMWLDMQGMELPVLRASPQILATTRAVLMEVCRKELYADSPLYPEVMSWMRGQGFAPMIDRVGVALGNVLFVRPL